MASGQCFGILFIVDQKFATFFAKEGRNPTFMPFLHQPPNHISQEEKGMH